MAGPIPTNAYVAAHADRTLSDTKGFQVVDLLGIVAQMGALNVEDWARIEALALELQTARRGQPAAAEKDAAFNEMLADPIHSGDD